MLVAWSRTCFVAPNHALEQKQIQERRELSNVTFYLRMPLYVLDVKYCAQVQLLIVRAVRSGKITKTQ